MTTQLIETGYYDTPDGIRPEAYAYIPCGVDEHDMVDAVKCGVCTDGDVWVCPLCEHEHLFAVDEESAG